MTGLLGPNGNPISSVQNKKAPPPILGEKFASIANAGELNIFNLPGGGLIGFDLNRLTIPDFRQMTDHYQVNNSLTVLTFMLHQIEWHIECENVRQREFYEEQLQGVWSRLVRAMGQAFWAGFSPSILQWENDVEGRRISLDKVKDLLPEECLVNWKEVEGYAPSGKARPKIKIYDGIKVHGLPYPVPVANSFWYPLLMQNTDYYGKKLLRSAFQPWFFSQLIHLFSNRYFERFGEPTPVGRAPYDDSIDVDGKSVKGNVLMGSILQQFRNRSVVVLPNDKTIGSETTPDFDYQIEYLESQMRGADFERYLTRLDEEISLSLFTPILMTRTADVGSYNLGTQHTMVYMWMLNAISGDWALYINKYILRPLRDYNFGTNAEIPRIKFVRMGKVQSELLQAVITELMRQGVAKPDVRELGELAGLTLQEVEALTGEDPEDIPEGPSEPSEPSEPIQPSQPTAPGQKSSRTEALATGTDIVERISQQVHKAFASSTFGSSFFPTMGYRRRMEEALRTDGVSNPMESTRALYSTMDRWLRNMVSLGRDEFVTPESFVNLFRSRLMNEIQSA